MTTNPANSPWDTIFVLPGTPGVEATSQMRGFESPDVALVDDDHGFAAARAASPGVVIYTGHTTAPAIQAIVGLALTGHRVVVVTEWPLAAFCSAASTLAGPTALDIVPITGDDLFTPLP